MQSRESVGYLLQHVAGVLTRQSDQVLQERLGIGMSQYKLLMLLQDQADIDQRQLGDYLGQTEASISRQVRLLRDKGLVLSEVDPAERRRHRVVATTRGLKVTLAAQEVLEQYQAPFFSQLNAKQQAQLQEALTILHQQACAPGKSRACEQLERPPEGS